MSEHESSISSLLLCSTNERQLEPLKARFVAAGIAVDCATRADVVRERLWSRHYDGVAIDLLLADRDGISFAMELRQEHPCTPMLVLSTSDRPRADTATAPGWLQRSADYARLIFALKQAGQRSAGHAPNILHIEDDDDLAALVNNTIGRQAHLFRARSTQEAKIAMALRHYDLALVRSEVPALSDRWQGHSGAGQQTLCVSADGSADPFVTILSNLRRNPMVHQPAYC
jgi:DNA-binding response OmpR family regulator